MTAHDIVLHDVAELAEAAAAWWADNLDPLRVEGRIYTGILIGKRVDCRAPWPLVRIIDGDGIDLKVFGDAAHS